MQMHHSCAVLPVSCDWHSDATAAAAAVLKAGKKLMAQLAPALLHYRKHSCEKQDASMLCPPPGLCLLCSAHGLTYCGRQSRHPH
jgi:hypothetical protein